MKFDHTSKLYSEMSVDFDNIVPVGLISTTANTHIPAREPLQIRTYHEQTLKVRSYFQHFFLRAHFLYVCFTDFTSEGTSLTPTKRSLDLSTRLISFC